MYTCWSLFYLVFKSSTSHSRPHSLRLSLPSATSNTAQLFIVLLLCLLCITSELRASLSLLTSYMFAFLSMGNTESCSPDARWERLATTAPGSRDRDSFQLTMAWPPLLGDSHSRPTPFPGDVATDQLTKARCESLAILVEHRTTLKGRSVWRDPPEGGSSLCLTLLPPHPVCRDGSHVSPQQTSRAQNSVREAAPWKTRTPAHGLHPSFAHFSRCVVSLDFSHRGNASCPQCTQVSLLSAAPL